MSLHIFQLLDLKKGFSLPLWVAGAAKSAVKNLLGIATLDYELITIPNDKRPIKIKIHSAACINGESTSLAISFADSGLDLDITNNLEIWTIVSLEKIDTKNTNPVDLINIMPGYGVGINKNTSQICMSSFAKEVIRKNLIELIPSGYQLNLEIIFPKGKFLAERTSNKSFGIVEGLSIIGTSAETYKSASPDQLKNAKLQLEKIIATDFCGSVVFVIGENGLDLAMKNEINLPVIKVGNWIGPLLVDAAIKKVNTVILFGYHGKLIKLAGGIFHTHNHLADARIEILVYLAIKEKIPIDIINKLAASNTVEDALAILECFNLLLANKFWEKISNTIEVRSMEYINRYIKTDMRVSAVLFDKKRKIRWTGNNGEEFFKTFKNY